MLIKLGMLKALEQSITKMYNTDLPIKLSYKISKMIDPVGNELQKIEEQRIKLVEKYGEKNETGITVTENNLDSFNKEFSELLEVEIDLPITPINLDDIPEEVKLTGFEVNNLIKLGFLIVE
jgi:hypothetical protein